MGGRGGVELVYVSDEGEAFGAWWKIVFYMFSVILWEDYEKEERENYNEEEKKKMQHG